MKKLLSLVIISFLSITFGFKDDINMLRPVDTEYSALTDTLSFYCQELLGRPTSNSITINASSNKSLNVYYEYGLDSNNYNYQTGIITTQDSIPFNIKITNLTSNTKYFYRMRYRLAGSGSFLYRYSHSFRTKRASGISFCFAIEADPHLDTNSNTAVYALTLQNIASKNPDFLLDLGDTFMSEKLTVKNEVTIRDRHLLFRSYFDKICHSIPLFLVLGNHEGECGWYRDTTANNFAVWASNARTKYYPNPLPDTVFYTGNTVSEPYVGLRQNYYAWEWGNCLFVVIDPYWYTMSKPGWGWTLGQTQFNWFKNVLTSSQAKFKFVFCHQVVGGNGTDGRGGVEIAHLWENGGRNLDSTWGFDTYRQGWGGKPVHQLMVENKVNIFFHGHDHFFGYQSKDGVIYQELPQPSSKSYTNLSASQYGYVNGVFIPSRGYALVSVTNSTVKVEYIRTYLPSEENSSRHNGDISYAYTIDTSGSAVGINEHLSPVKEFTVKQNYPNPFNPSTLISYSIPSDEFVQLKIFDLLGREIAAPVNGFQKSGSYEIMFRPDEYSMPGGVYFARITYGSFSKTLKMLYIK